MNVLVMSLVHTGRPRPIGAPGGGVPCCLFCDRPDTENCTGFPTGACKGRGRFAIFQDSAQCHKPGALEKLPKRTGGKIGICCFPSPPPHAPEPNPAWARWKPSGRRRGAARTKARRGMQESINAMPRGKEIPVVKTFDCLAR